MEHRRIDESHTRLDDASPDELDETLLLTRAFVALLLAERAGPLTSVQRDLLETIALRVDHIEPLNAGGETMPASARDQGTS